MARAPIEGPAPAALRGANVALGNLDGVHLGHQAVVRAAAAGPGRLLAAAVFEPHPRLFFQPNAAPFRLQTPDQRARALAALGVEAVFALRFDSAMAGLSDEAFAREVLAQRLGLAHVAVGRDFRFGRGRMGDVQSLTRHGQALGFSVGVVDAVDDAAEGEKISSTAIRACIGEGRPEAAAALLGRAFAIEGPVLSGAQRGRTIGFPTANQGLGDYVRPRFGVYAVRVDLGDGVQRPGVANCGVKPTVGASEPLLETHVFDFEGDLYGRTIEVALIAFLRPERRFDSFPALTAQIAEDAAQARRRLA